MRISRNGRVGIGTHFPRVQLHVSDTANDYGVIMLGDDGGTSNHHISHETSGTFNIWTGTFGAGTNLLHIDVNGNVGINETSPDHRLHVATEGGGEQAAHFESTGNVRVQLTSGGGLHQFTRYYESTTGRWEVGNSSADGNRFYFNPTVGAGITGASMVIKSTGNVGIGTVDPTTYSLDVHGKVGISRDGQDECCGNDATLALAEATTTTGRRAGISFHNAGIAEGTLELADNNTFGRRLVAYDNQSQGMGLEITGTGYQPGGGSWGNSSDERLKKNIKEIDNALSKINQLRGVTYEWIHPDEHGNRTVEGGFIAQEMETVFPQWVSQDLPKEKDKALIGDDEAIKTIQLPFEFDAYLVEAIKELTQKIERLEAENAALKASKDQEIDEIKAMLRELGIESSSK